jgi:hypothetical protein
MHCDVLLIVTCSCLKTIDGQVPKNADTFCTSRLVLPFYLLNLRFNMGGASIIASSGPDLGTFLRTLAEEGRAVVGSDLPASNHAQALEVLGQFHQQASAELGVTAPEFSAASALWGAQLFYQLCRFVVCRDLGVEEIKAVCAMKCSTSRAPATDWSVDLTMRHLPRLFQLAEHLSNADELLSQMRQIATDWPLSSVGIEGLNILQIESFANDQGLCRLYADRIIDRQDVSRLGNPHIDDLVRADLGMHRELAPALAESLFESHDTH